MADRVELERTEVAQQGFDSARARLGRWLEDAALVAQEAEDQYQEAARLLVVEDCLTELDNHLHSLPEDERQIAIDGIREYKDSCVR